MATTENTGARRARKLATATAALLAVSGCAGGFNTAQNDQPATYTPPPQSSALPAPVVAQPIAPLPTAPAPAPVFTQAPAPVYTPPPPPAAPPAPAFAAPAPTAAPGGVRHTVQYGDTAFNLSKRYGVTKEAIQAANGLDAAYTIRIGQDLIIPGATGPALAAAPAQVSEFPTATAFAPVAAAPAFAARRMLRPVRGSVTRPFGASDASGAKTNGVGISAPAGSQVIAADDGRVAYVSDAPNAAGSVILIEHAGGIITVYGRVDNVTVRPGQTVSRGAPIARVAAPRSGGPMLHFELRHGTKPIDPTLYI